MINLPDGNFLVPDATALVEGIVFVVVLFVVAKWVMPRLSAKLDDRRRLINDELQAASEAVAEARRHEQKAQELLRDARRQARTIIDGAFELRDFLVEEGKRRGREEYEWFSGARTIPTQALDNELIEAAGR